MKIAKLLYFWKNLSVATKLYFVVGIMTTLIAGELITIRFAMRQLSGARAMVGGESVWSKAQKDAVFSLLRFGTTKNPADYQAFLNYLKIPEGDHRARLELSKPENEQSYEVIAQGFRDGHFHEEDIPVAISLLRRFHKISYLNQAIQIWTKADGILFKLKDVGIMYHDAVVAGDTKKAVDALNHLKEINEQLTPIEEEFSNVLGMGSRWLEMTVLGLLTIAVILVESFGITLTFLTSRALSQSLKQLIDVSHKIGHGDFTKRIEVESRDEIGELSESVNIMGSLLQKSYGELEDRVRQRTQELSLLAAENEKLYKKASDALKIRDEFLSVASHELKTPITSLKLQLQLLKRNIQPLVVKDEAIKKLAISLDVSNRQVERLTALIEDLLDISKIEAGKMSYQFERIELKSLVTEVLERMSDVITASQNICKIEELQTVYVNGDPHRIEQVLVNLLSNAMKYGEAKPIHIEVKRIGDKAKISVQDQGIGIEKELHTKIFNRFERGNVGRNINGLGLGLFISKEIVVAHGGNILVDSEPGRGAHFTIELPCEKI